MNSGIKWVLILVLAIPLLVGIIVIGFYFTWMASTSRPPQEVIQKPLLLEEATRTCDSEAGEAYTLLQVLDPGIKSDQYALCGEVRYASVEGKAYLEMLNHFGPGEEYFSRTLGDSGEMQSLTGSADWRPFALPFSILNNETRRPDRLTFNVHFPGKGTVWVRKVRLEEVPVQVVSEGAWFEPQTAGRIGGWMGTIGGLFGGLIGCLGGYLIPRGRGRGMVVGLLGAMAFAGLVQILIALSALVAGQPFHVTQTFLVPGIIELILGVLLIPVVNRRFEEAEMRRMVAMDVG